MSLPPALASNPRVLTRVLEQVATGNRRLRGLSEALDLEARVVAAYLSAAAWLGFLDDGDDPGLTKSGLAYVYAGPRRAQVWAETAAVHPLFARLCPDGLAPTVEDVLRHVTAVHPSMDPGEGRRRARIVHRLLAPAWRIRRSGGEERQLPLLFASGGAARRPALDLRAGTEDSPDVYAVVLRALLDAGELTPAHVRGVLDAAGGDACGIGAAMAMAVRRGDARRVGDVLVLTTAAVERRAVAESAVGVALSDPDFRRHLDEVLAGRPGDTRRFKPWMTRLFGPLSSVDALRAALDAALFGRPLARFPLADGAGATPSAEPAPFLSLATRRDLLLAFPEALRELSGGVSAANRALRAGVSARAPGLLDRRHVVHGGLVHPGESAPRTIPDMVALRARVLMNVPAYGLLCALAVLDRRGVLRLRVVGPDVLVEPSAARAALRIDALLDALAAARGWWLSRAPGGISWADLVDVGVDIGLLARPSGFVTLDEVLFRRMQTDPEHRDLWEGLQPLADLLEARAGRLGAVKAP
jgi:hypothetical protein